MTKFKTYVIIAIMSVALIGLVYIQVNWLQSGLQLQKKLFKERAFTSLDLLHDSFDSQHKLRNNLTQLIWLMNNKQKPPQTTVKNTRIQLTHLMDSLTGAHHVETPYHFYVFNGQTGLVYLSNVAGVKKVTKEIFGGFRVCAGSHLQKIFNNDKNPNTCSINKPYKAVCGNAGQIQNGAHLICSGVYQIGVVFPEQDQYLLSSLRSQLLMSLFFIILILACFTYTIRTILKQRKLAMIKNDFINNLTHELKTPIFSISLVTKVFRENITRQKYDKANKYLNLIDTENEQLKNHVEKVLQLALMENKRFELDLQVVDFHAIIEKTALMFEFLAQQKNGCIKLRLNARNSRLIIDETHLASVLHSLLDNALKYTTKAPEIEIITEDHNNGLHLSVRDNGIGICSKDRPYIFEKFYRVSTGNVHNVKGFGLGLSYVKMIVEAHKGIIRLNNQWKQGAEFQIFLPHS